MGPIRNVLLKDQQHDHLWFLTEKLVKPFPFKEDAMTTSILDLQHYNSDVIFVPGNEVPHYLRGLKVQIFHGLAGEKKGHFRIRNYFDLYLTQGPYFTKRFLELRDKYRNFDVIETGWPKLDVYGKNVDHYASEKNTLLSSHNAKYLVLYAPTFSPSLTSAPFLLQELEQLAREKEYLIFIKFHDLMERDWIAAYQELEQQYTNIHVKEEKNIVKFLLQADILISDTSSVIYEFLLLDKPVLSYKNISENIQWDNRTSYDALTERVRKNLMEDPFKAERERVNKAYHPYRDCRSAERMVKTVNNYIKAKGVPERRPLSASRKLKIHSIFGRPVKHPWRGQKTTKLTALLITYNEVDNIDAVIENIGFADEIIIVDSDSTTVPWNVLHYTPM